MGEGLSAQLERQLLPDKALPPMCHRLATTDGRCSGLRMGTGCVGTWLTASKNVPALRRPMPSSCLTGPASGGELSRRVSQHAGLADCKGGTLRTASVS